MTQLIGKLLASAAVALVSGMAYAFSLGTVTVSELYSESEIVVEAELSGIESMLVDGEACAPLTRLKVMASYKGGTSPGAIITAWGYFDADSSNRVIVFLRKGSPVYAPNHPISMQGIPLPDPDVIAWKRCSAKIPYSVTFYGSAILPVRQSGDLSGEIGVLFPNSFIAPPGILAPVASTDPAPTSATTFSWASYDSVVTYIRSLAE